MKNPFTEEEQKSLVEKFSSEYERGLLALIVKNQDLLVDFRQRGLSEYFLYTPHKLIYLALCSLADNSEVKKIDIDILYTECEVFGLKASGIGPDYLALLSQGGADKSNFDFYFSNVKDAYLKYSLYLKFKDAENLIEKSLASSDETKSAEEIANLVNSEIVKIQTSGGYEEKATDISERARDFVAERAANPGKIRGLQTGLPTLDNEINGLMPGTLTVFAGQAKSGKSTILLNICDYIAIQSAIEANLEKRENPSVPILYISTEMYTDEDISRLLAMRSLIPERQISNGTAYNDPKFKTILDKAITQIEGSKIYHIYMPDFSASKVANTIYHYKLKYNIGLAVFDYIKMDTTSDGSLSNRREDQILGDLTTTLKATAGKLNIPVITACQINSRTLRIADSDRIKRYCNTLIQFFHKDPDELEEQPIRQYGSHWLYIDAARAGGSGKIPIRFWKHCSKIEEADRFETQEDQTVEEVLTTPSEWDELNAKKFKIQTAVNVHNSTTLEEMNVQTGEEDVSGGSIEF